MNESVQSLALSLLQNLSDAIKAAEDVNVFLHDKTVPSDLLSENDKFITLINNIDTSASMINQRLMTLSASYKETCNQYKQLQSDLVNRVNVRKSQDIQPNTNVEIYDPENLLFEFKSDPKSHEEIPSIRNVVEINKLEEYTVLSVINRLTNVEPLNIDMIGETVAVLQNRFLTSPVVNVRLIILRIKDLLNSDTYMSVMSSDICNEDCAKAISTLKQAILVILNHYQELRQEYNLVFQIFVAVESNYTVYQKAVDSYCSFALESVLSKTSYYEIM